MENRHGCINGVLQGTDKYSAAVPVIGLYIAIASAVCALLMLYDILHAFIKTQRWFPCKWFKLNSVTLSLIGVVVKLNVDLTTSMPSALDQLSKLAGTTSLCIYMCYIFPSIPDMKDTTNMFALSILVITVFVNMCIQLSTGVIALFIPENIIVMCLTLALLVIHWYCVFLAKNENKHLVAEGKYNFTKENIGKAPDSFLHRLKVCYMDNFKVNPQFRACRKVECGIVGDISLISLAILIQATIRSIVLKKEILCTAQSSDYQWSMAMIVTTQFVFIVIGSFASSFRRWSMLVHLDSQSDHQKLIVEPYCCNPILKGKFSVAIAAENVYSPAIRIPSALVFLLVVLLGWFLSSVRKTFSRFFTMVKYRARSIEELANNCEDERFHRDVKFESFEDYLDRLEKSTTYWIYRKSRSNVEKLIEGSKRKSNGLCKLLSSIIPLHTVTGSSLEEISVKLHPLVALVKLVQVAIPESPSQVVIVKTFTEAFETLHFIEKHMHNTTLNDIKETEIAKAVWMAGDFSHLLPVDSRSSDQFPPDLDHALCVMNCVYEKIGGKSSRSGDDSVANAVIYVKRFLSGRPYTSTEELGKFMQDLFAYMLDVMLAQLPDAIFKAVVQSPDEEFEERVRQSLKHLLMFESWDGVHKWKPPNGCTNWLSLFDRGPYWVPYYGNSLEYLTKLHDPASRRHVTRGPRPKVTANLHVQDEGEDHGDTGIQDPVILNEGKDILLSEDHHVAITCHDGIVEI